MTPNQERARQRAFERGQSDWREGKQTNPYPPMSPDHDVWEQGQESERDIHQK
jgi:hypothetical protein